VLDRDAQWDVALPVQVKARQKLRAAQRRGHEYAYVQGLKKSYVQRSPALCLAVYWPETGGLWFIAGTKNIIRLYDRRRGAGSFARLAADKNVGLRVAKDGRVDLPPRYKVPLRDRTLATSERARLRSRVQIEAAMPEE
jgi:hypothetical protein